MKSQFVRAIFTLLTFTFMFSGMAQADTAKQPQVVHESGDWQIYGESPHYLDLGLGVFDANGDGDESGAARAELRFGKKVLFIGPAIGFLANLDGGYFGYGGIYADIIYKRLAITPFAGAGGYEDGDGMDLGGTFQFRTALSIAYQYDNLSRLGIHIGHISNADIHDKNPGQEDAYISFSFPFR